MMDPEVSRNGRIFGSYFAAFTGGILTGAAIELFGDSLMDIGTKNWFKKWSPVLLMSYGVIRDFIKDPDKVSYTAPSNLL